MTSYNIDSYLDDEPSAVGSRIPVKSAKKQKAYVKEDKYKKAYIPTNAEDYF
jgi:hypothetical protein